MFGELELRAPSLPLPHTADRPADSEKCLIYRLVRGALLDHANYRPIALLRRFAKHIRSLIYSPARPHVVFLPPSRRLYTDVITHLADATDVHISIIKIYHDFKKNYARM